MFLSILVIFLTCPVLSPAQQRSPTLALTLPDLEWALEINAPDFNVEKKTFAPMGDAIYIFATNKGKNVILSAFLEKASRNGTLKEWRDNYWNSIKKNPLKKEQVKMYDYGEMPIVEYMIPEHFGVKVNQKHLHAFLTKGNYWVHLHLSKILFKAGDEELFQPILSSVKINDSYTPTVSDLFQFGNLSFLRKDFQGAIPYYQKALELEKHRKSLGREERILLFDQLGMSYGLSGDLIKAKETYEWAITQEPEYPMFFYNLACTYAEMNKMDEALHNLRLAYKYKRNVLPGQTFPDPKADSSFKKYVNNKIFIAELQKMK
jgi:tetratricopeptide (TPR) repeat protein